MSDSLTESSDDERLAIRDELKSLSLEELLKLKEKIGLKCYNSQVFKSSGNISPSGFSSDSAKRKSAHFKRGNKNRPREESSKIPVKSMLRVPFVKNEGQARDPRFDSLSGEFNEAAFMQNYSFLKEIKKNDIKKLESMHRREDDPDAKQKVKLALQRLKNQQRSYEMKEAKFEEKKAERERNLLLIKEGKKAHFRKKSEKKAISLIDKYEELKFAGKLNKYVEKKNKQLAQKTKFKYSS